MRWRPIPSNSARTAATLLAGQPRPRHRRGDGAGCRKRHDAGAGGRPACRFHGDPPRSPSPIVRSPRQRTSSASLAGTGPRLRGRFQLPRAPVFRRPGHHQHVAGPAHWIVAYWHDDAPVEYFHYDRDAKQARPLFSSKPGVGGLPLVTMEPSPSAPRRSRPRLLPVAAARRARPAGCRWCCWCMAGRGAAMIGDCIPITSGSPTAAMRC